MLLKDQTLYVHDVWDGKVASQLNCLSLGLNIVTADPSYKKKGLFGYIQTYSPVVVVIATPCWHTPHDVLAGSYLAHTDIPLLYVVHQKFWRERIDPNQLDFFIPPTERVLFRYTLTGLSMITAIQQALKHRPVL